VLTTPQRDIFDQVKAFVLKYRGASAADISNASLTMPNRFPASERKFITDLAADLRLFVTWDEYDEQDQNLCTWRLPGASDEPIPEEADNGNGADEQWEDVEEDEDDEGEDAEASEAVDRILKKYEKAKVAKLDAEGDFDARYEQSIREKMDEWKRGYYKVYLKLASSKHSPCSYTLYRLGQTGVLL
jgi:5'-3' exoribonuclease 1